MKVETWAPLAGLGCLAIGFAAGRWGAPSRTEERARESAKTTTAAAKTEEKLDDRSLALETGRAEKMHLRLVRRADGSSYLDVHRSNGSTSVVAATQKEAKRETEVRFQDRIVEKETVRIVESARPQWSLEARGGATLDARLLYGGTLSRRIIGPVWAGAWIEAGSTKAAGLSIRVEW